MYLCVFACIGCVLVCSIQTQYRPILTINLEEFMCECIGLYSYGLKCIDSDMYVYVL